MCLEKNLNSEIYKDSGDNDIRFTSIVIIGWKIQARLQTCYLTSFNVYSREFNVKLSIVIFIQCQS